MTKAYNNRVNLQTFYNQIINSKHDGVSGVICIKSKKTGPVLGITCFTHGNEPSGLAAIKYLVEDFDIKNKLERGTLYLVVNNIEASKKYFNAKSKAARSKTRFIDHNMNRLPENLKELTKDMRSEVIRALELMPIFEKFTVGFDVHSTSQDSAPMIINTGKKGFEPKLVKGFPIESVISNIDVVQIGLPVSGFYGQSNKKISVFEIEAGQHELGESQERATTCAVSLLKNLKMINGSTKISVRNYKEYWIFGSVLFPNKTYKLTRKFNDFELIKKGTVFANGAGVALVASQNCHTFFCPAPDTPKKITEEIIFLSEPVRKRL